MARIQTSGNLPGILPASARVLVTALTLCAVASHSGSAPAPWLTNSLGMEFALVTPGSFTMGMSAARDQEANQPATLAYDQQPAHRVTLTKAFYLSRSNVFDAAYRRSGLGGRAGNLSWNEAAAYCAWLSRLENRRYRLPTEAEWEHAFRTGKGGVFDFSGREWVSGWHGICAAGPVTDPVGPVTGLTRVIRGGGDRLSLSPDASGSPWQLPPVAFRVVLEIEKRDHPCADPPPFCQAAVKQSTSPARHGPDPRIPYFIVRFALPVPPDNEAELRGVAAGLDPAVMAHQHSPGFEILPNGDALAVYFSARNSRGASESDIDTRFVQARLRYGAEEWDFPELFFDFKELNDQSGLLWAEGNTIRFFGGGRGASDWLPFKMAVSTNNGATWTLSLPLLDAPAFDYTAQPIVNAFRGAGGGMFFAMDGGKDESFLWRSEDNGIHWHELAGRTGGRHSTIVPLDDQGHLLSIGGKNTSVAGWSPQNTSADCGVTWSASTPSPFPALGSNQRPSLIRLANGHLCFVSDSYNRKTGLSPDGWLYGQGCVVGISADNGKTWKIKRLPVTLPHEADRKHGTLGYATARQAPNGVIHVLATMTQPCLHYEFNESWVLSDAGDLPPERDGGVVRKYRETYASGAIRAKWSARICPNGRYLLEGKETTYYESGQKEHEVKYVRGCKTRTETFWAPEGTRVWRWTHQPKNGTSTWVQYWADGRKRMESHWNTRPRARDLDREFAGLVADGPARQWNLNGSTAFACSFTNGVYAGSVPLPATGRAAFTRAEAGSR